MGNGESFATHIEIDPSVYRLSAIKKAAYRLSARGDFAISTNDAAQIAVVISVRNSDDDLDCLVADFRRQSLDQELREEIAEQTAPIANLLLAQAFSATSLIDPDADTTDFRSDPVDISQPDRPQ
jgi:His-Xaa-Ser system protein HxsD